MFTGLVEAIGKVEKLEQSEQMLRAQIRVTNQNNYIADLGDSIAVNGCCLTVASIAETGCYDFDISHESLDKTNLGQLVVGDLVNLERAMRLGDRLGGHLVLGHVDGVCEVSAVSTRQDGWDVDVKIPRNLGKYLIDKGSVCLNGVSLTINDLVDRPDHCEIRLTLIPTTLKETTLHLLKAGQSLNLEVDVLGKYLERINKFS